MNKKNWFLQAAFEAGMTMSGSVSGLLKTSKAGRVVATSPNTQTRLNPTRVRAQKLIPAPDLIKPLPSPPHCYPLEDFLWLFLLLELELLRWFTSNGNIKMHWKSIRFCAIFILCAFGVSIFFCKKILKIGAFFWQNRFSPSAVQLVINWKLSFAYDC